MIVFSLMIIVSSIIGIILLDYLIWIEFKTDKPAWIADGCPRGLFLYPRHLPREFVSQGNLLAKYRLSFLWLFHTPAWSRGSRAASLALITMRCLAAVNILMFPAFIILALLK